MNIIKSQINILNKNTDEYETHHFETESSQITDFEEAVKKIAGEAGSKDSASITAYTSGKEYKANNLISNNTDLYLVLKDFTASSIESDVSSGNMSLVNGSSVSTSASDAFMTTAEVDALFA